MFRRELFVFVQYKREGGGTLGIFFNETHGSTKWLELLSVEKTMPDFQCQQLPLVYTGNLPPLSRRYK